MRLILLVLFLSTFVVADEIKFSPAEIQWIKENPIVTYVADPAWLPYEGYNKKGQFTGIVPDVLALLSKQLPFNFKHIETSSWQASLDAVNSGKVMMISQSKYANKLTNLYFANTSQNPVVIVMQKGEKYVSSLHVIADERIGLLNNTTTSPILKKQYGHIDFLGFDTVEEGLTAVSVGKIDAFLCSLPRAGYEIAQNELLNLRIVGKSGINVDLGFGINKENLILFSILTRIIENTSQEDIHEVLSKWSRQEYVEKIDHTLLYISLTIFTIIVLMGIIFYLRLKHETQKRLAVQAKMLQQQAKMASMGEMMDAVAHQWKQPLNALSMYGELMKSDFDEGLVNKAYVEEMLGGVNVQIEHMITTLGEFRNFFRPNSEAVTFNLLVVINSVLLLIKDEFIKNNIRVEVDVSETLTLNGNENEFKHLILNLINNAKDAFKENEIKDRLIVIAANVQETDLMLSVQDSAGGISEAVIDSLFEANVTTKAKGKGTGIGLYMSAQIVEKMKGKMWVENCNEGACFKIKFPL